MARVNDIPQTLLTRESRTEFVQWLSALSADRMSKKQLAAQWSRVTNSTLTNAEILQFVQAPNTIK
jgi:hypothetical protein